MTPKRLEIYRRLGVAPPQTFLPDELSLQILEVFYIASRARRYEQGVLLPLSTRDISDVIDCHPIGVDRTLLDDIIFELDNIVLRKSNEHTTVSS